jgi:fumarate hydratase subunit beta
MKKLKIPIPKHVARSLRTGDEVELSGTVVTARDAAHKLMVEKRPGFLRPYLHGGVIYHCGPIVKKTPGGWTIVSAGPTTSMREEPYEAAVIQEYGVRAVIGKGGMGESTLRACRKSGAVYLHAVGGAAVYIAKFIKRVRDVLLLEELGPPEAFWILEVEDFPAVVTMDAGGHSLHESVLRASERNLKKLTGGKK